MGNIEKILQEIIKFRDERNWKQFHNPKDMALSLTLEAAEVLEHFQWKSPADIEAYLQTNKADIAEELADVLYWVLLMSHDLGIDIEAASFKKMEKNRLKYPVEKAKGSNSKYTAL